MQPQPINGKHQSGKPRPEAGSSQRAKPEPRPERVLDDAEIPERKAAAAETPNAPHYGAGF